MRADKIKASREGTVTASDIDDLYYENKRLKAEVEYLRGERAAVVAWLRRVSPSEVELWRKP